MKAMPPKNVSARSKGAPQQLITMPQSSAPKRPRMRVIKRAKATKSLTQKATPGLHADAPHSSAQEVIKVSPAMVLARLDEVMKATKDTETVMRAAVMDLIQRLAVMEASITKSLSLQEAASRIERKTVSTPFPGGTSEHDPDAKVDANGAAKLLSISRAKFYAMVKDGHLPQGMLIGHRSRRWTRVELLAAASAATAGCKVASSNPDSKVAVAPSP